MRYNTHRKNLGKLLLCDGSIAINVVHTERGTEFVLWRTLCADLQRGNELLERNLTVSVGIVKSKDVIYELIGTGSLRKHGRVGLLEALFVDKTFRIILLELLVDGVKFFAVE